MRRVWQDLSAVFGSLGHPVISVLVYWGCAGLAYPIATEGGYGGAVGAAFVFCLSVLFLAYWLGAGALAFAADSRRSCLPGSQRLARRANFLASALLLPALALPAAALAQSPVWRAWVPSLLVLGVALAGVLAPLLPVAAVGLLLLIVLTAYSAASGHADRARGMELLFGLLSAALALAAVAKWRRVLRQGATRPSLAPRLRAIWIRLAPPGSVTREPYPAVGPHGSSDRQSPAQIIRTCLGGPFAQLRVRQLMLGAVLLVLLIVAAIGLPVLGAKESRWAIITLGLAAAWLVASAFLTQISKLTREQLAELALMPGLGTPRAQRRAFHRAVLVPPLLWFGVVLLLGSAGLFLTEDPLWSIGVLAACLLNLWLTYTAYALQQLVTIRRIYLSFTSQFMLLYFGIYIPLSVIQIHHWWIWFAPALFIGGIVIAIVYSTRRLLTAPHPFLI